MAIAATLVKRHGVGGVTTALVSLVFSGSYATGGDAIDFAAALGYTNRKPDFASIKGIAGYTYDYDRTNNKIMVRQSGAVTGTVSPPSFTINTGTHGAGLTIGLSTATIAGTVQGGTAFAAQVVLTTTSPVGTPAFTGGAAAAQSELPASSYPAGVTGDTVTALITYISTPSLA